MRFAECHRARLKTKKFGTRHQRVDGSVLQGNADAATNCIGLGLDVIARNRSQPALGLSKVVRMRTVVLAGAWAKKTEYFTSGDFKVDTVNGTDLSSPLPKVRTRSEAMMGDCVEVTGVRLRRH